MALTLRSNGTNGGIVSAAWWNDYYNLLTGQMSDQLVELKTNVYIQEIASAPGAPTLALATGTNMGIGTYEYAVTFADNVGHETLLGTTASISTTSGNQSVQLSAIPTGPSGIVTRYIYRTKVGGSSFFRLWTINDNTTTSYLDTNADSLLSSTIPPANPADGGLYIKNAAGATTGAIHPDGSVIFDGGAIYSSGGGNLYVAGRLLWNHTLGGNNSVILSITPQDSGTKTYGLNYNTDYSLNIYNYTDGINVFKLDHLGDLTVTGSLTWGAAVGGAQAFITTDTVNHVNVYWTPQSGAANGHAFVVWNGTAQTNVLAVGGNFVSAPAWIDQLGNMNSPGFWGPILTVRNGTNQVNRIFTGTNTPSSPAVGDIWIKA